MKNPLKKKEDSRRRKSNTSSVKVNSYIPPRRKLKEPTENKRKKAKQKRLFGKIILGVMVLIFVSLFVANNSRITEVAIPLEQLKYRSEIEEHLNRNPFARFKIFISANAIEKHMSDKHPEIAAVESDFSWLGGVMDVRIVERRAQLLLKTGDTYLIVDQDGYAYDTFDISSKTDNMVILTDDTEVGHSLNETVTSTALISFIEEIDPQLRQIKAYKGQEFSYRITDEARVLYIKPSGEKYEIKMQLGRPGASQVEALESVLGFYSSKSIKPTQYVDVRVNGTVYYK